jgi:DNA-binding CsgD family transcriptional regulator
MMDWAADLLMVVASDATLHRDTAIKRMEAAVHALGFEYFFYLRRGPLPLTNPRLLVIDNYPESWRARYEQAGYLEIDPTIRHARNSTAPLVWSDEAFADAPALRAEAQAMGLRFGWTQATIDGYGIRGILSLVRGDPPLTASELETKELSMSWLAQTAHAVLPRSYAPPRRRTKSCTALTRRETDVLKWHGDGKTAGEISEILSISVDTVKFHTRNAAEKLGTSNKTAAVVRAAMLGLLN